MLAISTVLLILSAVGVNADVPDDVVYTDVRKIVIEGDDAVLKCQFRGTPLAVYWKKGSDPRSAPNLITWFGDQPHTGSCVEDGACEMADDFSLILKEVGMEDQGRYICRVSSYKGILIHNFTDVKVIDVIADIPEGVVYTDLRKIVIEGHDAVLKCQFRGTPIAVYWKKGSDPSDPLSAPNLITWVEGSPQAGFCVEDGTCQMSDDFSLILKEVGIEDQGRYICRVSNYMGKIIYNFTDVRVIDPDQLNIYTEPYVTGRAGSSVNLPCNFSIEVKKVLWKRVYWDGGSKVETILRYTSDGHEPPASRRYSWSENFGLIIRDLHVFDEGNFTCLVLTVDGIEIENSTVLAVNRSATQPTTIIIVVVVITVLFIFVIIRTRQYESLTKGNTGTGCQTITDWLYWIFCWKKPHRRNADMEGQELMEPEIKLNNLRKKLQKYQPGNATDMKRTKGFPRVINLGVFGIMSSGKSSLINSLKSALTDNYDEVVVAAESIGTVTKFRDSVPLTEHVTIIDNKGMKDFSESQVTFSLMPQIRGERGQDPDKKITNGDVIHCPIFVHNISRDIKETDEMQKFLQKFSRAVHDHYGRHVMVIFTHKEEAQGLESIIQKTNIFTDVPMKHIWSFENYTENNDTHDVGKSIDYLEFLEKCLKVGEMNIQFEIKKKQEVPTGWCTIL